MNSTMTYEMLYNNMVKKFTVEKDNTDYNLGDFMLMKARAKKNEMVAAADSKLPVARDKTSAITTVFSYVNDKLTVKQAPVRNKTIRSFPFRTSFTAFCSALIVCALVVSCCFFGLSKSATGNDNIVTVTEHENQSAEEDTQETAMYTADFNN